MIPIIQKVIEAAKLAGIHDTIMRLPEGYDTPVPSGGFGFSRGFRQRLGLARAFFGDPRLVVLDEPNASLDYVGERVLLDAIEQMKIANATVIVITHRMGILAATNKIAIMQGGTVTAFGDSEEIFETAFKPTPGSVAGYSARECRHGRENLGGASCPVIWKRQETQAPAPDLLREPRFAAVITGIDEFAPLEFAWCSAPTPTSPRTRLRGVTLAGNLLILCFVLGLGTWSGFAPLESAAVASGVVESESSRKTIQHLEGGIIRKILVADGDVVRAGQILISLEDIKARAEVQSLQGQLWDAMAREARLQAEQHGHERVSFPAKLEMMQNEDPSVAAVLAAQQSIFETRRQVFQSQAAVNREKKSQVEKEIEGLRAQENAASRRVEIVREEAATVALLVNKGLERRPRLLNLERETADIEGRRGEIVAQISRAEQVIDESQVTLLKLESDRQNEIAQSIREAQNQIFQIRERLQAAEDQLLRTAVRAPEDGVVTELRIHTPGGVIGAGAPLMDLVPRQDRLIVTRSRQARGHRCGPLRSECRCDPSAL